MNSFLLVCDVFSFVFWKNPWPEKNVSRLSDLQFDFCILFWGGRWFSTILRSTQYIVHTVMHQFLGKSFFQFSIKVPELKLIFVLSYFLIFSTLFQKLFAASVFSILFQNFSIHLPHFLNQYPSLNNSPPPPLEQFPHSVYKKGKLFIFLNF